MTSPRNLSMAAFFVTAIVAILVVSSGFMGIAAAETQFQQEEPNPSPWCISYLNSQSGTSTDTAGCSAVSDISQHQQVTLDYSFRTQQTTEYITISLHNQAIQPADAKVTVLSNGNELTDDSSVSEYSFVDEKFYPLLTQQYQSSNSEADTADGILSESLPESLQNTPLGDLTVQAQKQYTDTQYKDILQANFTPKELTALKLNNIQLQPGEFKTVQVTNPNLQSGTSYDYTVKVSILSRGNQVADTQFSLRKTTDEIIPEQTNPQESSQTPSSSETIAQILPDGFDVVLNETIETDISRYSDGTTQISPLQDQQVPPNAGGSNSAVGTAQDVVNLREDSTQYPAVIFGSSTSNELHFGSAYYGIPQANNHYLILTYAFQASSENSQAEVRFVNRDGQTIDSQEGARFLSNTVADSIDISQGEQFREAVNSDTLNTEQVVISLTQQEVQYINDNYEAFITYRTDGGEDTLLLYEAKIASTDIARDGTPLSEISENNDTTESFEDTPATFDINYRVSYDRNPRFNQIDVLPNEEFKVPVTLTNTGDTRVERTIGMEDSYEENNLDYTEIISERTVMVEPQSQKTVILSGEWSGYQNGNHSVRVVDATNPENVTAVSSDNGDTQYPVYVYQPPTFEIVGSNIPDSWVQYDHFRTLLAVQNVGDLSTDFYEDQPNNMPYISGNFGPWTGQTTKFVEGGNVRAGNPGGTINMYFTPQTEYSPDYPNPGTFYSDDIWRNNAPYHTQLSEEKPNGELTEFNFTAEAIHPWAIIDGQNSITGDYHREYITFDQMTAPQLRTRNDETELFNKTAQPGQPFINYNSNNQNPRNDNNQIYLNELRNCHIGLDHTTYTQDVSDEWNETQIVNNCGGVTQQGVSIYQTQVTTLRIRNGTNEMVESRYDVQSGEWVTPGNNQYHLSGWPYTESDTSTTAETNLSNPTAISMVQYESGYDWQADSFALNTVLSKDKINALLQEYANDALTRNQLRQQLLTQQAYQDGKQAFTDRALERATSCTGTTTSEQNTDTTPPNCDGFGLESDPIPSTLITNPTLPQHINTENRLYVDVHAVNPGDATNAYTRVKITTNRTNAGIGGSQVVGYGTKVVPPQNDTQIRIPIIIPNNESAVGTHTLRVSTRSSPDYTTTTTDNFGSQFLEVEMTGEGWSDFNFKNMSIQDRYTEINEDCSGLGYGQCENTGDNTLFTKFSYQNHGSISNSHTIIASTGFWNTPMNGNTWPTLHHQDATERTQYITNSTNWIQPGVTQYQPEDSPQQKDPTQQYGPTQVENWTLQKQFAEPGIYRLYTTQERVTQNETGTSLPNYENTTTSVYAETESTQGASEKYKNTSHWREIMVYDITDPVSRFYFEAETYPTVHTTSDQPQDSRRDDVTIWEGGTIHIDGKERTGWTQSQYTRLPTRLNVSSDNVGIDTYQWTIPGQQLQYQQAYDNRDAPQVEGKTSRRFNTPGTYDITLDVTDYTQYTENNPNTNQSTQTVTVEEDTNAPTIAVSDPSVEQNHNVDSTDTIWTGVPVDRTDPFTTLSFTSSISDGEIGVECAPTDEFGNNNANACYWEQDTGTFSYKSPEETTRSDTLSSTLSISSEEEREVCVSYTATDFAGNENTDENCFQVQTDSTAPNSAYSGTTWVWADHQHADSNTDATFDAGSSTDRGDSGENPVGLHDIPFDHSAIGGSWTASSTASTTYAYDSSTPDKTVTETVNVRDWYGNTELAEHDITVYSDNTAPTAYSNTEYPDYTYGETGYESESPEVCPSSVSDSGVNGGIGIYDDGCTEVPLNFNFDTSIDSSSWETTESPTCDSTGERQEVGTWSDTQQDDNTVTTTVEDKHGNTKVVSVTADGTADADGEVILETETITSDECNTGGGGGGGGGDTGGGGDDGCTTDCGTRGGGSSGGSDGGSDGGDTGGGGTNCPISGRAPPGC